MLPVISGQRKTRGRGLASQLGQGDAPVLLSQEQTNKMQDNLDGYMNFYSCSGDGRVTLWTIMKTSLWCSDLLVVTFDKTLNNAKGQTSLLAGARTIEFKPDDDDLYLVGTDEGGEFYGYLEHIKYQIIKSYFQIITRRHFSLDHRVFYRVSDDLPLPHLPCQHHPLEPLLPLSLHLLRLGAASQHLA